MLSLACLAAARRRRGVRFASGLGAWLTAFACDRSSVVAAVPNEMSMTRITTSSLPTYDAPLHERGFAHVSVGGR